LGGGFAGGVCVSVVFCFLICLRCGFAVCPIVSAFPCFVIGLFALLFWLFAYGVGLSLFSYWFICVAPVRGSTYFSLPPQRKVGKRKRAQTASL
jgi:hypothetical protein